MTILKDLAITLLAMGIFGTCVLPVGWVAGRWLAPPSARAAWTLLLGVALVPLGYYLLARFMGSNVAWTGLAAGVVLAVAGLRHADQRRDLTHTLKSLHDPRLLWAVALWVLGGWLIITDLQLGNRLSLSGVLMDYSKHVSVTDAISRTGIPPVNQSYYPGTPQPLFYYYFWFLLCSLVDQLGGGLVTAKHAVFAGTLWAGALLVAALRVYADMLPGTKAATTTAVAAALLLVTGLDLMPFLTMYLHAALAGPVPGPLPDLEWWNEQITAWLSAVLWVPHHVAALAVCLTGFRLAERGGFGPLIAGAAFACALGMSIWVTLTAAVIGGTWCLLLLLRRDGLGLMAWGLAGATALLLALPFVLDLHASQQSTGAPIAFSVREFFPLTRAYRLFGSDITCGQTCRLLALPLNYSLEFGFFGLTALIYWVHRWRRGPLSRNELFLLVQAAAALVFCSLFKSAIVLNDLGWRGMMFVQFALLLWAAPIVTGFAAAGRWQPWLKATAALGLAATTIQAIQLRSQPATERNADLRRTYEWIAAHTPVSAIVQHNPAVGFEGVHAMYGNRQAAYSDQLYARLYGIDPETAEKFGTTLEPLFADPPLPLPQIVALAHRFGISHLVAKAEDPVWHVRDSWLWAVKPLFATASARVVAVADLERLIPKGPATAKSEE